MLCTFCVRSCTLRGTTMHTVNSVMIADMIVDKRLKAPELCWLQQVDHAC